MKKSRPLNFVCFLISFVPAASPAEFSLKDDGTVLTVLDNEKPVLCYNYGRVDPPAGIDKDRWWRSCYIHPLYGLDGDVLTQDYPPDHLHHRGVYWAWPKCQIGERAADIWVHKDIRQRFLHWTTKQAGAGRAEIEVANAWVFSDDPEPYVIEEVRFVVRPADERGRAIDVRLRFTNRGQEPVSFLGAAGKGYGGFCFRPDATRKDPVISTELGVRKKDALKINTRWADFSSRISPNGPYSGVAIFQHPENPGYPHSGWILRYYGFLGASWPHLETVVLNPSESVELRYRLYIHRGTAQQARVAESHREFIKSATSNE
ncbi:MAG: PmoA family protein [Candidatus Hydrogenedentes bacterium]|nr:PmoA family protein [Candidatus Hydrogenedentota bacterium]